MKKIIFAFFAFCILSVSAFAEVNIASCTGCHGLFFEKSAMNKSKIVANMSKEDISKALLGYKLGTYGGSMKNLMKMQVSKYSNKELKNTGIGKDIFIEAKITDKVFYSENNKFAYKENDKCWVVDYSLKKSNSVECYVLIARLKMQTDGLLPPGIDGILFQDLFK